MARAKAVIRKTDLGWALCRSRMGFIDVEITMHESFRQATDALIGASQFGGTLPGSMQQADYPSYVGDELRRYGLI